MPYMVFVRQMSFYAFVASEYRDNFPYGSAFNVSRDIRILHDIQKEIRKRRLQNLHDMFGDDELRVFRTADFDGGFPRQNFGPYGVFGDCGGRLESYRLVSCVFRDNGRQKVRQHQKNTDKSVASDTCRRVAAVLLQRSFNGQRKRFSCPTRRYDRSCRQNGYAYIYARTRNEACLVRLKGDILQLSSLSYLFVQTNSISANSIRGILLYTRRNRTETNALRFVLLSRGERGVKLCGNGRKGAEHCGEYSTFIGSDLGYYDTRYDPAYKCILIFEEQRET